MPVLPNAAVPAAGVTPGLVIRPFSASGYPNGSAASNAPISPAGLRPSSGFGGALKALAPGSCQAENSAVTSAVPTHLRVEPANSIGAGGERPALGLMAWEALAHDPLARPGRVQMELERQLI
jgi:hypothetical protein